MARPLKKLSEDDRVVDIAHFLFTNDLPNLSETIALREEVEVLRPKISSLRAQLTELEDRLFRCNSALSQIRTLPQEVIGTVFDFALDAVPPSKRRSTLLQLGKVCKMWNEEAHNPTRWAEATIELTDDLNSPTYEEMELQFKYARDCPRTITIRGRDCRCQWDRPCQWGSSAVMQLLLGCPVLKRLALLPPSLQCFQKFQESFEAAIKKSPPTSLSIQSFAVDIPSAALQQVPGATNELVLGGLMMLLPSLTSLSISLPLSDDSAIIRLPMLGSTLGNLTRLNVKCYWNTLDILNALRHCQNLQSLLLDYHGSSAETSKDDICDIILPRLHTFDVTMPGSSASSTILPRLVLPALADLRLFVNKLQRLDALLNQLGILSGTSSLRSLTVWNDGLPGLPLFLEAEMLVNTLFHIPSLRRLSLDKVTFDPHRFVETTRQMMEGGLTMLPVIQSIELFNAVDVRRHFDIDEFLQSVKIRQPISIPGSLSETIIQRDTLRRVVFGYSAHLPKNSFQQDWELASDTMQLLEDSYGVVVDSVFLTQR